MLNDRPKPLVLIILDGWGYRTDAQHNPLQQVPTPHLQELWDHHPHTLLEASGKAVGLPADQMGNSEVGHLHLGAGRRIPQDLTRIDEACETNTLKNNSILQSTFNYAKENKVQCHFIGLLSPGGVHSHEQHLFALLKAASDAGVTRCYTHAILDGRDVPPKSAESSLKKLTQLSEQLQCGHVVSMTGRYYAMDRDKRWERTEKAYDLLTAGLASYQANDAMEGLQAAYQRGESDEFVKPTVIGKQPIPIQDNDVFLFFNFRADRPPQLSEAFTDSHFTHFSRKKWPHLGKFITLTHYGDHLLAEILFAPMTLKNTLGEFLASHHLTQLRLAETEKYAHVTYFFNGGLEIPFPQEHRQLIPSPKIATYDLQPAMSAIELTDALVKAIHSQQYDIIICNYANPDMIGHTGVEKAAQETVKITDQCIGRVREALKQVGGEALITADHGNIECMYDEKNQQPHTAHTTNPVPLIYIGRKASFTAPLGSLADVAPTLLYILNLTPPKEMDGQNLLRF